MLSLVKDGATDGVRSTRRCFHSTAFALYRHWWCLQSGIRHHPGKPAGRPGAGEVAATGDCRQVAHDLLAGKGVPGNETYFTSDTGSGCRHGTADSNSDYRAGSDFAHQIKGQEAAVFRALSHRRVSPAITRTGRDKILRWRDCRRGWRPEKDGTTEWATGETGKTITESFITSRKTFFHRMHRLSRPAGMCEPG